MPKLTISDELTGFGVTGSNVDLEGKKQYRGYLFCIQRVSVTNETTDSTNATIGIKVGSNIQWLETIAITSKGLYYALKDKTYINEGKSVIVRFKGTSDNDVLKAFVYGYIQW